MIGGQELIIIFLIILLLFGAKKLPELAQGLGKGIREFKKAAREIDDVEQIEEPKTTIAQSTTKQQEQEAKKE
ncbi:MAG: twin-arginine translocase TatA/TatE family subunit [candidate division KSB1 bacterium]|nr:twin-arginine translocase TatA/TatE family subunit [candidate division KSB1 bacterium]MDQ7066061.1 twin-arginine translocase TatA/TatE family subunit [candidate division KSB1 bacterium]